ncbi:glycosyltransferase [Patescibacteria group bacterium]|nr:glycosyltransferase [Patescibacteria group bacterium]MBU1921721.1 glycosyltransferase [Patescibacteria group bacterium]
MKVLMISTDQTILGQGSKSFKRMLWQASLVESLIVLVLKNYQNNEPVTENNLKIFGLKSTHRSVQWLEAKQLGVNLIKKYQPDVVSCQDPFYTGYLGYILSRGKKMGLNIQLHGDFFSSRFWRRENFSNYIKYFLGLKMLQHADSIRVVSKRIEDSIVERGVAREKIIKVSIPVSEMPLGGDGAEAADFFAFKNRFIYAGRFSREKNLSLLIKSFAQHAKNHKADGLYLIGDGVMKQELMHEVALIGLGDNIKFFGWQENLKSFFTRARALVLPSFYEGWSRVCVESLLNRVPVIMTDVGCAGELVRDGVNGIVVPVNDKNFLTKAISRLSEDDEFYEKLVAGAPSAVAALPSEDEARHLYIKSWKLAVKK